MKKIGFSPSSFARIKELEKMDIAVLGTGRVGGALGPRWASKGHRVVYGVQDADSEEVRRVLERTGPQAAAVSVSEAAASSSVILLAIPWNVTRQVVESLGPLDGKILLDCINPMKPDFSGLILGAAPSAAEEIAAWAPNAHVIKAFNTVGDAVMTDPRFADQQASMFYCGDDEAAKAVVRQLTLDVDLEPVDAGPLKNACYLESLAMLYIHLAIFGGWGAQCAFKMIRRG
jgi:8-hydroxy-5-deazaflavin:NADPH oxidoreductase